MKKTLCLIRSFNFVEPSAGIIDLREARTSILPEVDGFLKYTKLVFLLFEFKARTNRSCLKS